MNYCCDCLEAKVSTVSSLTIEGVPIYHLDPQGRVVHRVRCSKSRWTRKGGEPGGQLKSLPTLRNLTTGGCADYLPMDLEGAEDHRLSLPETQLDYEEVWRR